jgi:hypothetical protein
MMVAVDARRERDEALEARVGRPLAQFIRNVERICGTERGRAVAKQLGWTEGRWYAYRSSRRELPEGEVLLEMAATLGVLLDTLLGGIDAKYDAVAQNLRGVPSGRAADEIEGTQSVQGAGHHPAGQQEGRLMSEWARLTGQLVDSLKTEELREAAYDALEAWNGRRLNPKTKRRRVKDPPAGREVLQRQRK